MKLRQKLKRWLFKEELEDLKNMIHEYFLVKKSLLNNIELMESILDVGVDVSDPKTQEYSWAVVCIKGHPEHVRFVNLTGQDASQVLNFLKHFENSNVAVDSPVHFRQMFEDRFIKNPFK